LGGAVRLHAATLSSMAKAKIGIGQQHIEAELAFLRAAPQVQSVASLERGEVLLAEYGERLSTDEMLLVLRVCASGCQAAGRWLDGLQFAQRALDICGRDGRSVDRIPFLAICGNIHSFLHNYHLAVRSLRDAIHVAELEERRVDVAKLTSGLGAVYSRLGEHDIALSLYERSETLAGELKLASTQAAALNNVARQYRFVGKLAEAQEKIDSAFKSLDDRTSREWLPYLLHTRAEIAVARRDTDAALHDLQAAAPLLRELQNTPVLLRVLADTAELLVQRGETALACDALTEASALSHNESLHDLRATVALSRARLAHRLGDAPAALAAIDEFLSAQADAEKIEIEGQRIATRFVEEVERSEARGRRETEAVSALTLRLLESQAEAEKAAKQASRDSLTGVLNRNAFEAAAMRVASGVQQPVTLLMLDVDDFKAINERFGHIAGDAVLSMLVDRMRQSLRSNDLLGRYGGDEFLLLCPGVGPRIALAIVNRMLAKISAEPMRHDGHEMHVTVSLGAACAQTKALPAFSYMVKRADAALRRAKLAGKNRAIVVRVNV
jgi:diguanylate cyclase (GGDEF)-like protein